MKLSKLFSRTSRETPGDETAKNAQLLIRAGYIQKEMAGVYDYLPLGLMVLNSIIEVIREEMNELGGQEVLLSTLQNPEPWQASGRWNDEIVNVWFKTKLKSEHEVGLANTHEEALTGLMRSHVKSYQDLPAYIYQFQTKFRNELRAKSGLLRTREFIMKDLYSFCATQAQHDQFYRAAQDAYNRIFKRLGLAETTYLTFASGGSFAKFSHEFQTICEAGEDTIYVDPKKRLAVNKEVLSDEVLSELDLKREDLEERTGAEVGNIFSLSTTYSDALGLKFTAENGEVRPVVMGSYGIGPGRVMGVLVELFSDEHGLVWPEAVAPFNYHLISVGDEGADTQASEVYDRLTKAGQSVLFDDRKNLRAGAKFAEADLLGMPVRLVISDKTAGQIEYKKRSSKDTKLVNLKQLVSTE